MKFEAGQTYDAHIIVRKNTGKTILAERLPYDPDKGESLRCTDSKGEHRYKIYIDQDGDEYTIIDRFRAITYEVYGHEISSNPNKPSRTVYISG